MRNFANINPRENFRIYSKWRFSVGDDGPALNAGWVAFIRESPQQFENRIIARVYVRSITRSAMYQKAPFVSRNWCLEN